MATSTTFLCGICEARHVTKCAEHWCPECQEGLCSHCHDHHSLFKGTRKHLTISIDNYRKLPAFIVELTDICKEHGLNITHFCKQHDDICCLNCTTTKHRKCEELQLINEVIKNAKTSAAMSILEKRFEEMLLFINQGIQNRKQNISSLGEDQQHIKAKIKEKRGRVNSHLDELEKDFIKQLTDRHGKTTFDIQTRVNELSAEYQEIGKLKDNILAVKTYGTDLQAFLCARQISDEVNRASLYLKSTSENKCFHHVNLIGKIEQKVIDILSLTSFGEIDMITNTGSLEYKAMEEKEAQIIAVVDQVSPKSVNEIQLNFMSSFMIPKGKEYTSIWGCAVFPDGKMVFSDNKNKRLVFVNIDNSHDKDISIDTSGGLYDVTVVDHQTVAVSTDEGIKIIEIDSKIIKNNIKTKGSCYGITCTKQSLMWCEVSKGIKKMTLRTKIVSTILKRNLRYFAYLKTFGDKIYFTDTMENNVKCVTIEGQEEWQFKDSSILGDPTCITVDSNMFVYTTSFDSDHVVIISPDGQQGKQLLSSEDGLDCPTGICFDRNRNKLVIVNSNGIVFSYQIYNL